MKKKMIPIEKQVTSLEPSKRLKELGVKQDSYFFWHKGGQKWYVDKSLAGRFPEDKKSISAFTVAELGEMLPIGYRSYYYDGHPSGGTWMCNDGVILGIGDAKTEADARAKMLILLIENKVVGVKKKNEDV